MALRVALLFTLMAGCGPVSLVYLFEKATESDTFDPTLPEVTIEDGPEAFSSDTAPRFRFRSNKENVVRNNFV